jgi:anti-anti-sigma factor
MKLTMVSRDTRVVRLAGEGHLTSPALDGVDDPFDRALAPDDFHRTVVIDLAHARYLNSSGISWLIETDQRFRQEGGRLVLHSLTPPVREIARLTHLASLLDVVADESAAQQLTAAN